MTNVLADSGRSITLDHIAHFVPERDAAGAALTDLGFTLTPFSEQSHRPDAQGPLLPAGTGNRCVMLKHGYLEFLTPILDTPNAAQLRAAIARYTGVHLIAFGTTTPHEDYARLQHEGFTPLSPMPLQREAQTPDGTATARFTVVRVPPAVMAEGRIQYCQHHTPDVVWQPRWLTHANHAVALAGVLLCVADAAATAERYAKFTGLAVQRADRAWLLDTARGHVLIADAETWGRTLNVNAPTLPWIAGYVLDSDDMRLTAQRVGGRALGERVVVDLPPALGGMIVFQPAGSAPLHL